MQFGCFVQLEGLRGRHEGLVHVSQVRTRHRSLRMLTVLFGIIVFIVMLRARAQDINVKKYMYNGDPAIKRTFQGQ